MIKKLLSSVVFVGCFTLTLYGIYSIFRYITFCQEPIIELNKDFSEQEYNKELPLQLLISHDYSVKKIDFFIDLKKREPSSTISLSDCTKKSQPLSFSTEELLPGEHILRISCSDKSYHTNEKTIDVPFVINKAELVITQLPKEYAIKQGKTLHFVFSSNRPLKKAFVTFLETEYPCYKQKKETLTYETFIPIDCEQLPGDHVLKLNVEDKGKHAEKFEIPVSLEKVNFPRAKGFAVKEEKIEQEKEVSMNDAILEKALTQWLKDSPQEKLWHGPFEKPTQVKAVSTPFGEIRTTTARGRYYHKGIDIINNPRAIVWASNHGKVIIKDRFVLTGNTVVLDHGRGIFTLYYHLEEFADIQVGSFVKKGNPLGKLGMTGYASGYHLHWELRVNNVAVDPLEWTEVIY